MISPAEGPFVEIALSQIGQSYGRLRLVHPQADAGMVDSLRQFGQIFPIVVVALGERYELVDGFKRLRAMKQLGYERVKASVVTLGVAECLIEVRVDLFLACFSALCKVNR